MKTFYVPVLILLILIISACSSKYADTGSTNAQQQSTAASSSQNKENTTFTQDKKNSPDKKKDKSASSNADSGKPAAPAFEYHIDPHNYLVKPNNDKADKKVVLLTFDDAPKSIDTLSKIISVLEKHHAKAIFFCNGYRIKAHPELLKYIHNHGESIGNHSWDHIALGKKFNQSKVPEQIASVQTIVKQTVGVTPRFFRPPYASSSALVKAEVAKNHLVYMTWSDGSLDWTMSKTDPSKRTPLIIAAIDKYLGPGANILMHELPWTADSLDQILTHLEDKGYHFVDPGSIASLDASTDKTAKQKQTNTTDSTP